VYIQFCYNVTRWTAPTSRYLVPVNSHVPVQPAWRSPIYEVETSCQTRNVCKQCAVWH